ncbi:MAG: ATP-binding protein [Chthoniobacterales bacterium]
MNFFQWLFDTSSFPDRWSCGDWSAFDGWLLILSDLAIFAAYSAIPISIAIFIAARKQEVLFPSLYWLFAAFIFSCGFTHLIDAIIFWQPVYRLSGVMKFITAIISGMTAVVLIRSLPQALSLAGTAQLNTQLNREIEEHRRSEAELVATSTRLELALQHSKLGDWVWDQKSDSIKLSNGATSILGLDSNTAASFDDILARIDPRDRDDLRRATDDAIKTKSGFAREFRLATGDARWASAQGLASIHQLTGSVHLVGILQDITERKQADAERDELLARERASRASAENANRLKDEFLATLSHELRTPLNAILGWSDILAEKPDPDLVAKGCQVIGRNVRVQTRLVEDLLDLSRITNGQTELERVAVDVIATLAAAVEAARITADRRHISLTTAVEADAPLIIGDQVRLDQIFSNLLSNALKFTEEGGRIHIRLTHNSDHLDISISDTGVGISTDALPIIFERFRQADSSTTRHHGGLGIGLSLVREFVEMHGGSIRAESPGVGLGTTMHLRLPIPATPPSFLPASDHVATATFNISEAPLEGSHILAVDDDPETLRLLDRLLTRAGASIVTARSAARGLEALSEETFDLLISDLGMPAVDGYEFIRQVRSLPTAQGGSIPAIAFTAFARPMDRQRALDSGYGNVLTKPVEPSDLLTAVIALSKGQPDTT